VPRPFNALEAIALEIAPDAARAREALLRVGAPHPVMSGSGSTYFSLFESEAEARRIHEQLTKEAFGRAILARFATL
jgi:4-diphosphocytidyl-2C-methyl-D-erythritol kinase